MNRLVPVSVLAAFLAAAPAFAKPDDAPQILTNRVISGLTLDELFVKLKENAGSPPGQRIEQEILRRFNESGSPTADLLLTWAVTAIEEKNYPLALDVLDQLIAIKPDFAEAFNKRATVHFLNDDYGASLSDIRATLALEPRHFGALTGLGTILQAMDRKTEAIRVFERTLEIDPQLDKVRESLEALKKEVEGSSI